MIEPILRVRATPIEGHEAAVRALQPVLQSADLTLQSADLTLQSADLTLESADLVLQRDDAARGRERHPVVDQRPGARGPFEEDAKDSEVHHEGPGVSSTRTASEAGRTGRVRTATTLSGASTGPAALVGRSSGPDPMKPGGGQADAAASASRVTMRRYGIARAAHTTAKKANAAR
jgi:hypothetical protein